MTQELFLHSIRRYRAAHPQSDAPTLAENTDAATAKRPIKAVLFDMDGVLFDSMPGHAAAWTKVCAEFGINMVEKDVYMNEGRTAFTTINHFTRQQFGRDTTLEEVERIYARKCEEFNSYPEALKMEGAQAVLEQVKADGLPIVVVTGSGQGSLLSRLTTHYPGFFSPSLVVSSKDVFHGKPHPEPYLMGLEKAAAHLGLPQGGLRPWEALVVENAPLGVRSAVAAGIFTIAVNTGPLPASALLDEGADLLLPSMTSLAESWPLLRECFAD